MLRLLSTFLAWSVSHDRQPSNIEVYDFHCSFGQFWAAYYIRTLPLVFLSNYLSFNVMRHLVLNRQADTLRQQPRFCKPFTSHNNYRYAYRKWSMINDISYDVPYTPWAVRSEKKSFEGLTHPRPRSSRVANFLSPTRLIRTRQMIFKIEKKKNLRHALVLPQD